MPDIKNLYLQRYAYQGPQIEAPPHPETGMIIVIPAFNEPDVLSVLKSLKTCVSPPCNVEIIVVVNHPANALEEVVQLSQYTYTQIIDWAKIGNDQKTTVFPLFAGPLPSKSAGVGLARKIGMDEAVWRFHEIGKKNGLIINLDVDCTCDPNYLTEIYQVHQEHEDFTGGVVHFEHPLAGLTPTMHTWIINYELHIRYYIDGLRMIGYPYAFHTIGSTMITTNESYQKQGGMNQRKAGEDFYFLHKIFPLGGFYRLNSTTVYPGVRLSDRVPFGTGKALNMMNKSKEEQFQTFHWKSFEELSSFFEWIKEKYPSVRHFKGHHEQLPEAVSAFLSKNNFNENVNRIAKHSTNEETFFKSFFHWFSGLKIFQFMHFCRDNYYPNIDIQEAIQWLGEKDLGLDIKNRTKEEILLMIRAWDKDHE